VDEFISEDDLQIFEKWLKYQAVDPSSTEELARWRRHFEEAKQQVAANPKVGIMKLLAVPGEHRYAVAVREPDGLWLTLWVRRSSNGEIFVIHPTAERDWNPHTSYHLDGRLHLKSHDRKMILQKRQALTGVFRGSEHLGLYAGHSPKVVGAVCDPTAYSGVVEVPPGVLGARQGAVTVDLVEPGREPSEVPWFDIHTRQVFRDLAPWVVITVGSQRLPQAK
jgi:hypothetical protein